MKKSIGPNFVEGTIRPLLAYLALLIFGAIFCILLALILDRMFGLDGGAFYWLWMITGIPSFVARLWMADRKLMALTFIPLATTIAFLVPWVFRLINVVQLDSNGVYS